MDSVPIRIDVHTEGCFVHREFTLTNKCADEDIDGAQQFDDALSVRALEMHDISTSITVSDVDLVFINRPSDLKALNVNLTKEENDWKAPIVALRHMIEAYGTDIGSSCRLANMLPREPARISYSKVLHSLQPFGPFQIFHICASLS
jgi:hypothetical protein